MSVCLVQAVVFNAVEKQREKEKGGEARSQRPIRINTFFFGSRVSLEARLALKSW